MSRQPDQQARADLLANLGDRQVVLTDVHAVGTRLEREVGPVVQPEQRTVLVAEGAEARGGAQDLFVRGVLRPQLQHVDPSAEGRPDELVRHGLHDEVEASPAEDLSRAHD